MTTGIDTSTVLATEKELPEFLAGLKVGGEIVVETCGTTWFRGVPDRKRYLCTESIFIKQHKVKNMDFAHLGF